MSFKKRHFTVAVATVILILLILDNKTAVIGTADGITLCINTIIPSLFPFFFITTYLNASLLGMHIPGFSFLSNLMHIPKGGESLLLLGLIGGYPVGAQVIADSCAQGCLDRRTAHILLGYCSNAGPAFIFGITSVLFSSAWVPWCLWLIHICSALLTGYLLPKPSVTEIGLDKKNNISVVQALQKSIRICASVCGWIILFKMLLIYIYKWIPQLDENGLTVYITGILELSNGCINLTHMVSEAHRFILVSGFLAFGGLCVMLQTVSATQTIGLGLYIQGKIIQTAISLILSIVTTSIFFYRNIPYHNTLIIVIACIAIIFVTIKICRKKFWNLYSG